MEDGNSSNFNKNNNTSKVPIPKCTASSATKASASNSSKQPARSNTTSAVPKATTRGRPPLPPSAQPREQDRYLPMANIIRVMRRAVPFNAKISDDAKDTVQECVSEFISFITEEANERCHNEQRKTITADDLIWAMSRLGFDNYVQPLSNYLQRYRQSEGLEPHRPLRMHQLPGPTVVSPPVMMPPQSMAGGGPHYPTAHNAGVGFGASHGLISSIVAAAPTTTDTDTRVGHPVMVWPHPVIGPNNPTIHYAGVGFGASHGSTSSTTATATAAATPIDYGFSPLNEICFDIGGSSNNDGLVDDIGLPPPFDTASTATSNASQGGGQQDESFDPFDHFK